MPNVLKRLGILALLLQLLAACQTIRYVPLAVGCPELPPPPAALMKAPPTLYLLPPELLGGP